MLVWAFSYLTTFSIKGGDYGKKVEHLNRKTVALERLHTVIAQTLKGVENKWMIRVEKSVALSKQKIR